MGSLPGPHSYETSNTRRLFHGLSHGFRSCSSRNPFAPLGFGHLLANPLSAFGRRVGLGATPRRTDVLRPRNPALVTPVVSWSGSLPARASGAIDPCGKASGPPAAGLRRRRGPRRGRRGRATARGRRSRPREPAPRRWGAGGPPPPGRRARCSAGSGIRSHTGRSSGGNVQHFRPVARPAGGQRATY